MGSDINNNDQFVVITKLGRVVKSTAKRAAPWCETGHHGDYFGSEVEKGLRRHDALVCRHDTYSHESRERCERMKGDFQLSVLRDMCDKFHFSTD